MFIQDLNHNVVHDGPVSLDKDDLKIGKTAGFLRSLYDAIPEFQT